MIKITELRENECIHVKNEYEANAICKLMHDNGLKYCTGRSYIFRTSFDEYKENTIYIPKVGVYSNLDYAKKNNMKIYNASYFLNQKND